MVLKFCKISAKECKNLVVECKKRPVHLNTKKQPQSCCLFDFLLKFFCLNVPETYYLGADVIGAIEGNPALNEAYEMGKTIS